MKEFEISSTTIEDIPAVLEMIGSASDALISVDEKQVQEWIDKGFSLVAKVKSAVVGHQAAGQWAQSGWFELRAAVVKPEFRGLGINTEMKNAMIAKIQTDHPNATFVGFTEAASKSRGILQKMGFQEIPLHRTPNEFFSICPENCVKKTGIDCGCKVFVLEPKVDQ